MNATEYNLPARLADVRSLARLSQAELAKKVGVSSSLISHWEKGTRVPSQAQLLELARNLGVALDYLLNAEVRPHFQFRARATLNAQQISEVERALVDASQQIHFLDTAWRLNNRPPRPFALMAEYNSVPDLPDVTAQLRETLKLNRRVTLAEFKQALSERNVFVFDWNMPWHLSGMSYRGAFTVIFINHAHPVTRRLFTLAHEFAHVLFHLGRKTNRPSEDTGDTAVSVASVRDPQEKEANAFAGEFLLPTDDLVAIAKKYRPMVKEREFLSLLAKHFNVSLDALFYRLTQINVFRWTEKSQYFSGAFQPPQIPEGRIAKMDELDRQVDPSFLETALKLHHSDKITTGKLAEWLFAQRHIVDEYLFSLDEETDLAISDGTNGSEGVEGMEQVA